MPAARNNRAKLRTSKAWARRVHVAFARLKPLHPDIDPADLHLILTNLLRPKAAPRTLFLRQERPGVYGF